MKVFALMGFKWGKAGLTLIAPLLLFLINPFSMALSANLVMCTLLLVILWWITGAVPRSAACVVLLAVFLAFGGSTPRQVFNFAFSSNFYVIILSYLLCAGITGAKATDRIAQMLLLRFGGTPMRLLILSFLLNTAFIFLIPQPFSRVILLTAIYTAFLDRMAVNNDTRRILMLGIYVSSPVTGMMFLNGDIIVNYSLLEFSGLQVTAAEWIRAMTVPSIISSAMCYLVISLVFKKHLRKSCFPAAPATGKSEQKNR